MPNNERGTAWRELQAAHPVDDLEAYSVAYRESALAGRLAELIYRLRTDAGLTQAELARRMATTQSSIARMEGGGNLPSLDVLSRLGAATGVTLTIDDGYGHPIPLNVA